MKKVVFLMVIAFFVVISCEKDDILPVDTFTRDDYVGMWSCTEVPLAKNQYFDCEIKIDNNNESNIKLTNFANLSGTAFAIVSGKNVVLPKQTINGNTIEGYGTMQNKNYITWRYYVKDNTDSASYNTNFNRK